MANFVFQHENDWMNEPLINAILGDEVERIHCSVLQAPEQTTRVFTPTVSTEISTLQKISCISGC